MAVDGLVFGYAEGTDGGHPWRQLYMATSCKQCGRHVWNRVNRISDLAYVAELEGTQLCAWCRREQEEREEKSEAAILVEEPDGERWLSISWDGQIKAGRVGQR